MCCFVVTGCQGAIYNGSDKGEVVLRGGVWCFVDGTGLNGQVVRLLDKRSCRFLLQKDENNEEHEIGKRK